MSNADLFRTNVKWKGDYGVVSDPLRLLACDAACHSETDLGLVAVIRRLRGQLRGRRGERKGVGEGRGGKQCFSAFFGGGGWV